MAMFLSVLILLLLFSLAVSIFYATQAPHYTRPRPFRW